MTRIRDRGIGEKVIKSAILSPAFMAQTHGLSKLFTIAIVNSKWSWVCVVVNPFGKKIVVVTAYSLDGSHRQFGLHA